MADHAHVASTPPLKRLARIISGQLSALAAVTAIVGIASLAFEINAGGVAVSSGTITWIDVSLWEFEFVEEAPSGPREGLFPPALRLPYARFALGQLAFLELPVWFPVGTLMITGLLFRWLGNRVDPGHCGKCNYNLTGNTSGRCPECGAEILNPETVSASKPAGDNSTGA